jgi:hypothetical protein
LLYQLSNVINGMINNIAKTAIIFLFKPITEGEIAKVYLFSFHNLIDSRRENITRPKIGLVRLDRVSDNLGRDVIGFIQSERDVVLS